MEGCRAARQYDLATRAVVLAATASALVAGCAREPNPNVIPTGSGWECKLDVCERAREPLRAPADRVLHDVGGRRVRKAFDGGLPLIHLAAAW